MTTSTPPLQSRLDTPLSRWIPANFENLLAVLLILLAIGSRFYDLGARSISHDEVNHVIPAYDYYSGRGYRYDPLSHGPFQFHLMALSYALFGDNDYTSRIPVAVFSVATVALALTIFRRYLGRIGALAAGVMFLISPYMLFYGRYQRNEAFIVMWGLLTIYAILRYLEKGETRLLVLFTLINALHFTDKATSYIFAAEELVFLAVYFLSRLLRRAWPEGLSRNRFLVSLIIALLLLGAGAGFYLTQKPMDTIKLIVLGIVGAGGLGALVFAGVNVVRSLGWTVIRSEHSFDLLMVLGTLVLPMLAAFPLKLAGKNPLDYSSAGFLRALAAILPLGVVATLLGLWWNRRRWPLHAALFYLPILILYTSFFTYPEGLLGGFVGALGYWAGQERAGQPLFYYALIQIPVYEFLPALGTITAAVIAVIKRLWQSESGQPFEPVRTAEGEAQPVPTVALTVFWSIGSLIAFSLAGEKMPWLTIHIALPIILAAGWAVGWLVETVPWKRVSEWGGRQILRAAVLAFFSLLAVLTGRAAFRAAYINFDYPFEYLVYAHAAPEPKALYDEIVELSRRTTGGLDMVVAYDNNVRYNYWWYMRRFPNRIDFDVTPTRDIRRALVILVSDGNKGKVAPVVRNDYTEFRYSRLWWHNQDYWSLKWDAITSERLSELGADAPPMNLLDYFKYAWRHIRPFFTDAQVRNAVWQIWFNRDFSAWAALRGGSGYTLEDWSLAERMSYYIRKDINSQIWAYGAAAQLVVQPVDPYLALTVPFTPDRVLGAAGDLPGQFQSPRAIALASDGSLYVVDSLNHRIQHLSPEGEVLQVWGSFADVSKGNAPGGTFNEPWGVAVGPDGSVYVADTWNHRIQKFTSDGQFLTMWGHGPADVQDAFYGPRGIVVDGRGRVFVADTGNKRITVFDSNGTFLFQIGSAGLNTGQFDEPVGVALDETGRLYVTDTWNQRVQIFAPDESGLNFIPVAEWPVEGWFGQSVENKPFIAVDAQANTFVTDPEACRVIVFSPDGKPLRVWGSCGEQGGFTMPDGLALDGSGGLWVSDARAGTIVHFSVETVGP